MKFLNVGIRCSPGCSTKMLGGQLLRDVQTFVARDGHHVRRLPGARRATYELLQAPGTAFLVVAAPERDALREASYFVDRLVGRARCRWPAWCSTGSRPAARRGCPPSGPRRPPTRWTRRGGARADRGGAAACTPTAGRGRAGPPDAGPLHRAHPEVPLAEVPALAADVHDLDGLRQVGAALAESARVAAPDRPPCGRPGAGGDDRRSSGQPELRRCSRRAVSSSVRHEVTSGRRREQRPPLTLGHAAPHAELDPVVQRVGQALGPHGAALHTALARFCAAPWTNSSSGSRLRHARAGSMQSSCWRRPLLSQLPHRGGGQMSGTPVRQVRRTRAGPNGAPPCWRDARCTMCRDGNVRPVDTLVRSSGHGPEQPPAVPDPRRSSAAADAGRTVPRRRLLSAACARRRCCLRTLVASVRSRPVRAGQRRRRGCSCRAALPRRRRRRGGAHRGKSYRRPAERLSPEPTTPPAAAIASCRGRLGDRTFYSQNRIEVTLARSRP